MMFNVNKQALRHKDQEVAAMKQKNSRLIKESTKEGKSRVKVRAMIVDTRCVGDDKFYNNMLARERESYMFV